MPKTDHDLRQTSTAAEQAARLLAGVQPRYASVATALTEDILAARLPVGGMLPSEGELCARFKVSRATVREALRRLREMGFVEVARGVGTRVVADQPRSNYVLAARSVTDVMGYAEPTVLDITGRAHGQADAALAEKLGCDMGFRFCRVSGLRRIASQKAAISCVELYIAEEFAAIADDPGLVETPAYRLIGQRLGIAVVEVRQDIGAIALDRAQAAHLGSQAGRPGLFIRRRFYAAGERLLEATLNVHGAADRFSYRLRLGEPESS